MLHRSALAIIGGLAMASAMPAAAKDITVHMKNKGADGAMVFEPAFVKAAVEDDRLTLHGLWTDTGEGGLESYDPARDGFFPV